MERTTKRQVKKAFEMLAEACGRHIAKKHNDVGGWTLDYNPIYGGYVIEEIMNEGGGVKHPFFSTRMTAANAYHAFHLARQAADLVRDGATKGPSHI